MDAGERLRQMIPAIDAVSLMPWDRRRAVRSWLRAVAPEAVVVVETEIWPNLFRSCGELGIPLFVVNGRLYPGDVARYRAARRFFAEVLVLCEDQRRSGNRIALLKSLGRDFLTLADLSRLQTEGEHG